MDFKLRKTGKLTIFLICIFICAGHFFALAESKAYFDLQIYAYSNDSVKTFLYEKTSRLWEEDLTAMSALKAACAEKNLKLTEESGYIKAVGGYADKSQGQYSGWVYKVNGKMPNKGANTYRLQKGDSLEWAFAVTPEQAGLKVASKTSSVPANPSSLHNTQNVAKTSSVNSLPKGSSLPKADSSKINSSQYIPSNSMAAESAWTPLPQASSHESSGAQEPAYTIKTVISEASQYLLKNQGLWTPFAVYSGQIHKSSGLKANVKKQIEALNNKSYATDYQRIYFNAAGAGLKYEPYAEKALDFSEIKANTLNYSIFALQIRNSNSDKIKGAASKTELINHILSLQNQDGSFSLSKDMQGDIDLTAMAVSALAPSKHNEKVKNAADKSVKWLRSQNAEYCESVAQMLLAANLYGNKELEMEAIAQLMLYRTEEGAFSHTRNEKSDIIATEQALIALSAVNYKINPFLLKNLPGNSAGTAVLIAFVIITLAGLVLALVLLKKRGIRKNV